MKLFWMLVLSGTLGLIYFLQHHGIELSSKDFVFQLPPRHLPRAILHV
jgi:hypothetical protein